MEISSIGPFLNYYAKIRGRTKRVIESIPPDKIEWSPSEGRWSFGDLMRHLANIERWMYAENVRGRPSRYAGHGTEFASGYEEGLEYFDELHARMKCRISNKPAARIETDGPPRASPYRAVEAT